MGVPTSFKTYLRFGSKLALDAPFAALTWWCLFAISYNSPLSWSTGWALFFATWTVYLVDRLYDTRCISHEPHLPIRKRFANRNKSWLVGMLLLAVIGTGVFSLNLTKAIYIQASVIASLTGIYFLLCRFFHSIPALKELLIGIVFATSISIPNEWLIEKTISTLSVALLGVLNCLVISLAESHFDHHYDQSAWFSDTQRTFPFRLFLVLNLGIGLALWSPIGLCILLSTTLLWLILNRIESGKSDLAQPLADAALWLPATLVFASYRFINS